MLKTYIVDDRFRIRLHDLVSGKAAELCRQLDTPNFPTDVAVSAADVIERVHRYEQLTSEALLPIMILGCFWGHQLQDSIWSKLLEWVANARTTEGHDTWLSLQLYPALLLLYGGGVAAMSAEKYSAVAQLLLKPRLSETDNVSKLILKLNAPMVVEDESLAYQLLGEAQWHAPMSFYLCKLLREYFREYLPSDAHYCEVFDRFEYLLSLVWADENPLSAAWAPLGCFAWERISAFDRAERCMDRVDREITELGQNWPLLRVGFFSGSYERLLSARRRVANFVNSQR